MYLKKTDLIDIPDVFKYISIMKNKRKILEKMSNSTLKTVCGYLLFIYNI